jgi:hypothetical protein
MSDVSTAPLLRPGALIAAIAGVVGLVVLTGGPQLVAAIWTIGAIGALFMLPRSMDEEEIADDSEMTTDRTGSELRRAVGTLPTQACALLIAEPTSFDGSAWSGSVDRTGNKRLIEEAIRQEIRRDDLLVDMQNGTYCIILLGAPQSEAEQIAERICRSVQNTILLDQSLSLATGAVSIGGVAVAGGVSDSDLARARANLLASKQRGPNNYLIAA